MPGEFAGKIVVVTGGSRGIGRGIAQAFAREGAQTVLAAMTEANLKTAADAIAKTGAPAPVTCAADLRTLAGCEQLAKLVKERFGRCDILVNSAGATRAGNFLELSDELWHDGFALKFFACVRFSRLLWPMLKERQGHIVNIIGVGARQPAAHFTIGGSVNAAMANFTKALSQLGKVDGVNVNAIHPGRTETDRTHQMWQQQAAAAGISYEEARKRSFADEGVKRIATVEDVAELALFLCSERARHIQGTAVTVDGGSTPGVA